MTGWPVYCPECKAECYYHNIAFCGEARCPLADPTDENVSRVMAAARARTTTPERDRLAQRCAQKDDEILRQREIREAAERRASALKGVATRMRNRAAAGVCPCCNRTFSQLATHMKKQHPDFGKQDVEPLKVIAGGKR